MRIHQQAISTSNKKGFTYSLTSYGKAFVNAASRATHPVMDIGAAYGVASLPALLTGAKVISVDIDENHLTTLRESVAPTLRKHLTTMRKKFPDFEMEPESLGAVYMSQVLPFLKGSEIEEGARKIFNWLIPGGELFIVSFTPYIDHVKSFIPVYELRKKEGQRWSGYIDDLSHFSDQPHIFEHLPNEINHVDADDLKWAFEKAGFQIREVRYFGEEEGELPHGIRMDGRERVGLIAVKPVTKNHSREKNLWRSISDIDDTYIPYSVNEWLRKPFVLTNALRKVCNQFAVTISDQCVKTLYADEISALKCFDTSDGYVRETYLGDNENPLVYARVCMPLSTYLANKEQLENLGNRPIGETLLYNDPTYTRSEFEVKRLQQDDELLFDALVHHEFYRAVIEKNANSHELWARRSIFTISGHQLLITEVFMPDMPRYKD